MHRTSRMLTVETLEKRRLLAQTPYAISQQRSGRCGDEIVHSQTPGVVYFVVAGAFSCGSNNGGPTIYRTDGTVEGTYRLDPVQLSNAISNPLEVADKVFFTTQSNAPGAGNFYQSDGSPDGAVRISNEATFWELNGDTYYAPRVFPPDTQNAQTELRRITANSDELVREIGNVGTHAKAGDVVLFTVWQHRTEERIREDGGVSRTTTTLGELWQTNGTPDGTFQLQSSDVNAAVGGEFTNGRAWFMMNENDLWGTWSTDGTEEGTFRLDIGDNSLGEKFGDYYLAEPPLEPFEDPGARTLRATDGISVFDLAELTESTRGIEFVPGRVWRHMPRFNLGDQLFFDADRQLWKTDGMTAESVMELGSGIRNELRFRDEQFHGPQYHATERYFYFEQAEPAGLFRVDRVTGEATQLTDEPVTLRAGTGKIFVYHLDSDPSRDLLLADDSEVTLEFAELGVTLGRTLLELSDRKTLLFEGSSKLEGSGYWLTDGTKAGTYKVSETATTDKTDVAFSEESDFFQVGNFVIFDAAQPNELGDQANVFAFALRGPNALPGDVDGDDTVSFLDFLLLAEDFGSTEETDADINSDGKVDDTDLLLLKNNFGKSVPSFPQPNGTTT